MDAAVARLAAALYRTAGELITYRRGDQAIDLVPAVRGRSEWETLDPTGVAIVENSADWLVQAADLTLDEATITPQTGDTIQDAAGETYDVRHPAGETPFRHCDHAKTRLRIHTKRRPG